MHPDQARGWLEAYMIRRRALHPEKLPPLLPSHNPILKLNSHASN
jgi:hypothetical protein